MLASPRDSGKTSWTRLFQRIIAPEYVASITSERQFSASMITEATQLVIIDEWSSNTMNADLAKTLLQGGWMVTAVKHGLPRSVNSYSLFYITTNKVLDFKDENDNVQQRIQVFHATSLPTTLRRVDRWMYDNAMHCIAWIADQLNKHHDLDAEELWVQTRKEQRRCPALSEFQPTVEESGDSANHSRQFRASGTTELARERRCSNTSVIPCRIKISGAWHENANEDAQFVPPKVHRTKISRPALRSLHTTIRNSRPTEALHRLPMHNSRNLQERTSLFLHTTITSQSTTTTTMTSATTRQLPIFSLQTPRHLRTGCRKGELCWTNHLRAQE